MKHVMIWLVRLYRKYISPLKPPCCRFTPTCSAYAIEAFEKRGFFIGFILTVWRVLRCNPFSKGGYDPVPEHGLTNPKLRVPHVRDIPEECDSVYTKAHLTKDGIDTACGENVSGENSPPV